MLWTRLSVPSLLVAPCSLVLYPSHRFSWVLLSELQKKGQKYDTFSRVFSRWGVKTTWHGMPSFFSSLRAAGLSLVLQCTSDRPFVCLRASRTWFLIPSGSRITAFSRVDFANFLNHIRKGCVPIRPVLLSFSIPSCDRGRGISCLMCSYHCLILLEALPSSWGGGALIK